MLFEQSPQKFEEFFLGEGRITHGACIEELVSKLFFSVLKSDYALFNGVLHDEAIYGYYVLLPDSVGSVRCLILNRDIPPVIQMYNYIGACKVKSCSARL